jgi:hypothetical protein
LPAEFLGDELPPKIACDISIDVIAPVVTATLLEIRYSALYDQADGIL